MSKSVCHKVLSLVWATIMVATIPAFAEESAASAPGRKATDKPLEEAVIGYWAPNWDTISVKWKPMFEQLAQLQLGDRTEEGLAAAEKEAAEEVKELCRVMTMEFTKDKSIQHTGPGRTEEQRYVVKKSDPKTGVIDVELPSNYGGKPELAKLVLTGDRLVFIGIPENESAPWILDRIDKATFEKRQAEATKSKLFKDKKETQESGPSKEPKPDETSKEDS